MKETLRRADAEIDRRRFLKLTAALSATAGLPAWISGQPGWWAQAGAAEAVSGNITVLTEAAADIQQTVADILAQFAKASPGVKVKHQTMAGGGLAGGWGKYIDGITTMIAG